LAWEGVSDAAITDTVRSILADVKQRGDQAVVEYSQKFDRVKATVMTDLEIPLSRAAAALESIPKAQRQALEKAAERVRQYHEHQKQDSWHYVEDDGTVLGQQVTPLDRAGLYVPGGKAAYPSSVLMNAIPAKVAGVQELIMGVPTP
ncbi:MAG TPA: histidinol dehydrogenase, partial [Methylophaga sp.]|nr:histidinol dehydrogenase [Methylophaga sp.]